MALLTLDELSLWSRTPITTENGLLATMVIDAVTSRVLFECGSPTWDHLTAPSVVRSVVIPLASRSFRNLDSIVAEGGIGPIGGDRYVEDMARALELTDAELAILHNAPGATAPPNSEGGEMWVLGITDPVPETNIIYVFDAAGSIAPDSAGGNWAIPMLDVDLDPYYKPLGA